MRTGAFVILAASLATSACVAPTEPSHSPIKSAQRVLAVDFSPSVLARREQSLQRLPGHVADEARRADSLTTTPADVRDELSRVDHIPATARSLATDELTRRPNLSAVVPSPDELGRTLSDDLGNVPAYLGIRHRPLRELDDREHRTDPADDRPEQTMWQRVARRLGLRW